MQESQKHWDHIRAQFDVLPYPNVPLDNYPDNAPQFLAELNYTIAFYLKNKQVISTQDKWILDAGCGSGYKLLGLALANPGANLVGIDISQRSLELTQQRLEYHGVKNTVKLHCLPVEDLASLPYTFDFITCLDVLYLLESPINGLKAMKSVLKPEGIIRANMHSALQRAPYYRVQKFLARLGCLVGAPSKEEMGVTRQTMGSIEDWVITKQQTWSAAYETDDTRLLANHLLRGDTGITMEAFSSMLHQADLEFIAMLNWRQWKLEDLFKSIEDMPISVALGLAEMRPEEHIQLYELLHPIHRLLDLYCGHLGSIKQRPPVEEWSYDLWEKSVIHLHPQLNTSAFKQALEAGAENLGLIPFDRFLKLDGPKFAIDSSFSGCLHSLLDGPKTMSELVERWLKVRPLNLITLTPIPFEKAFETVTQFLIALEDAGYIMLELQD